MATLLQESVRWGVFWTVAWFCIGFWIATVVRFVGPKRVHIITFLGTQPMQQLKTGIKATLPWPFGWTQKIVPVDVQTSPIVVNTKSKDNQIFGLASNAQWIVEGEEDPRKFAFERNNPVGQMENLITSALITGANKMDLEEIFDNKEGLQEHVVQQVGPTLKTFGITLVELVIEDPQLRQSTIEKLSAIREAGYEKHAAQALADAARIKLVGVAEAEKQSKKLQGQGLADMRKAVADGSKEAMETLQEAGMTVEQALEFLMDTNRLDTLGSAAAHGNMVLVDMKNDGGQMAQTIAAVKAAGGEPAKPAPAVVEEDDEQEAA